MPPILSKEEMDAMNESDDYPMSIEMLVDIHDGSQLHLNINSREASYKILDCIKQK